MDILIPTKKINISLDATALSALMKCGRYYDLNLNHKFQSLKGKGNSLEIGSIIHKFMEVYYKSQMNGISKSQAFGFGIAAAELYIQGCKECTNFEPYHFENPNQNRVDHICNELCILKPPCNHPVNEYPGLTNTPSESDGYIIGWKFALQTCDEYAKHYTSDSWVTLDTEVVKSKILYEDDEIRILWKAKLDWIVDTNSGIFPCDHKTAKQDRDTLSINNQFMGQCHIMGTRNVFINKIGLQKTKKPDEKFKRVSISYSASRLQEWQSVILPYWSKTLLMYDQTGHYPANFNSCESKFGKCNFYEVCESDTEMREEVIRMNFYVGKEWNPVNSDE